MPRTVGLILLLCVLAASASPHHVRAQAAGDAPPTREAGTTANLFETLDPSSPIDGIRLEIPEAWTIEDLHLLRYGTTPVPTRTQTGPDDSVFLMTESAIQGPHELVVRAHIGEQPGRHRWQLTPFTLDAPPETPDSLRQQQLQTTDRLTQTVKVEPMVQATGPNRALDLQRTTAPLQGQLPDHLSPGRTRSFTIEFWMRTHGLDQVLLSSWTGEENVDYPFEFVVEQSGRLRFYCGRAGRHEALRTQAPVADGHWHHAAVVYDEADARLSLVLDGTTVDSLRPQALPPTSGPLPFAIGGRRPHSLENQDPQRLYTGQLDELRIWPDARPVVALRASRSRPYAGRAPTDGGPFRLSFNNDDLTGAAERSELDWPEGAQRVATNLTFQSPLKNLRAQTDGQSVTLRWTATATTTDASFIVERSTDGESFSVVEQLSPPEIDPQSGTSQEMVFTDENVAGDIVFYRVRQAAPSGKTQRMTRTIKIGLGGDSSSRSATLIGNFPNPFRESTTIAYRVEDAESITLTVWDLSGKRVATLADGRHDPGYYEQPLQAEDLPSGPYFARLETAQGVQSHRMILLK